MLKKNKQTNKQTIVTTTTKKSPAVYNQPNIVFNPPNKFHCDCDFLTKVQKQRPYFASTIQEALSVTTFSNAKPHILHLSKKKPKQKKTNKNKNLPLMAKKLFTLSIN